MEIHPSSGRVPNRGVIAASIGLIVAVWAVNFIAAKIGLEYWPPFALASFRVVIAGLVMIQTLLFGSRLPVFSEAAAAQRRGFRFRDYWTFLYLGFFGVCMNQICFTL